MTVAVSTVDCAVVMVFGLATRAVLVEMGLGGGGGGVLVLKALTRLATLRLPSPVAKSYSAPAG